MNVAHSLSATSDATPLLVLGVIAAIALLVLISAAIVYLKKRK